jgi:hypothetical protein
MKSIELYRTSCSPYSLSFLGFLFHLIVTPTLWESQKNQQLIDNCQHGIDSGGRVLLPAKILLPLGALSLSSQRNLPDIPHLSIPETVLHPGDIS